jgi:hypothetical protein
VGGYTLDAPGLGEGPVAGSCGADNEHFGYIK